ncbi:MAG: DNA mismatch repair endonuclease MutL [Rikenellaceae bacterium]|nr:DNA mismatch repair endonuclease MutL [Rikenellaceae bacterium]
MENKIHLLPEIVANQIAAGEVVDNPASAIKEMMENSIDAGATSLTVNFRNAGLELIQIIDNGCGMSPLDARMAFDRHATSKIRNFDDVYRLQTFGFRGEALASIAAVAQVELRTRRAEDEVGTETIVNGGEFVSQRPTMCPVGSQFMVRNLFYTAPARRKFNSDRSKMVTEIKKVFRQVALCNPAVRCELMSNDMPIITLAASSLQERIIGIVGRHIKTNLLEVDVDTTIVKVQGYVGRPAAAKQKNAEQYLFVNGRYFRSPQIYRSIMKAYEKLIPEKDSPSYFLYLTIEPERVDVNVSPHKTEVRFADAEEVCQIISAAVRSTLAKSGNVSMMDFENSVAIDIPVMGDPANVMYSEPRSTTIEGYNPFSDNYIDASASELDIETAFDDPIQLMGLQMPKEKKASAKRTSAKGETVDRLRDVAWSDMASMGDFALREIPSAGLAEIQMEEFVPKPKAQAEPMEGYREIASSGFEVIDMSAFGEVEGESSIEFIPSAVQQRIEQAEQLEFSAVMPLKGGYAIAMAAGRTMIVDLRRAKERLLYDEYMSMLGVGAAPSQQLLFPERLLLSVEDYALLREHEVEFAALGFDIHLKEDCEVELCGIPSSIVGEGADTLLYDLLREVEASGDARERMREDMARMMAVRASRQLARQLSVREAEELLGRLSAAENYSYSPSGKAIMAELTIEELKAKLN